MRKVNILGIPIHDANYEESVGKILEMVEGYRLNSVSRYVATANVDFLVNTMSWVPGKIRHYELYQALINADLITADGMPVVWLSKILGTPIKERVTGADLVPRLANAASTRGVSLFFLGGTNDVAEKAAKKLSAQNPGLKIAGCISPQINLCKPDNSIIEQINQSGADILLIALGNPKQEIWFQRNKHLLKIPVSIGVGATFDFIAGTISRSPVWMQKMGFEWVYRLGQEPRRLWKRYCVDFSKFGFLAGLFILNKAKTTIFEKLDATRIFRVKKLYQCIRGSK
jgi:N-acetylglucosaminyldiphosphoundecaprenol N-acetyl-beta-D-mannosaminyltransferase